MSGLLPVDEALSRILKVAELSPVETLPLASCHGRVLAEDLKANRTQPPFAASAMDGYAVRHQDMSLTAPLNIIGEASAGHGFNKAMNQGEAVRIFTGAPMPEGSDTVLIQEDAAREGDQITPTEIPLEGLYVRPAGMDFSENQTMLERGLVLNFQSVSLAAAMNHAALPVYKKPRVGIISNGDELVLPGETPGPDQIIASNAFGVASLVEECGGEPIDLGIVKDDLNHIVTTFDKAIASKCDIIVTLGGASVGDHDLIKPALSSRGAVLDFWKIAMRPGKPFMFGELENAMILGMPGNPVSSMVCSLLFLKPLLRAKTGLSPDYQLETAFLENDLPKNGPRQAYQRSIVTRVGTEMKASVFKEQDSSILSVLAKANALVVREPHATPAKAGDKCTFMWL